MALTKCKECDNEISTQAEACPKCGAKVKTASAGIGSAIITLIVVGYLIYSFSNITSSSPSLPSAPSVSDAKQQVKGQVAMEKSNWHTTASGSLMVLSTTLVNHSSQDVKDIEITCEHFSKSGTKIDSNTRTIYEIVKAGKSKRVREFDMGFIHSQADSTSCNVSNLAVL